ncbi:MAG: hypothetical protein LBQ42_02920 [Synergistaceae bacterium]|jgi:hypothetical protein|nr:hypothetical protein [Synergistaceae bacterium]
MLICFTKEFCREMKLNVPEGAFFWEDKDEFGEVDLPESVIERLKRDYQKKTGKVAKTKIP